MDKCQIARQTSKMKNQDMRKCVPSMGGWLSEIYSQRGHIIAETYVEIGRYLHFRGRKF